MKPYYFTTTFKLLSVFALILSLSPTYAGLFDSIFSDEEPEAERSAGEWEDNEISTIDRPVFSMVYPANWKIASTQSDYDADRNFTIDSNGDSYINIKTFHAIAQDDLEEIIENMTSAFDGPLVETYSRSHFTTWGNFSGKGLHLKGKIMGMFPGGCRFFVSKQGDFGIIVVEYYFSEEIAEVMPAFELMAQSFTVK